MMLVNICDWYSWIQMHVRVFPEKKVSCVLVSPREGKSSQLRLTGGSKWTHADVGGYYIPLKQQKIFDCGLQLSFFQSRGVL